MADDPKIILDPPPAEPVDVRVNPDPPPAEPFDVSVSPDPPPGGTVDVQVSPDPGPRKPVDVTTSPDGPPREPYDVATNPDGPPLNPYDVPTNPDSPPLAPYDVPTNPDGPPLVPFDVSTMQDASPAVPFDVTTTTDGPPSAPFDVVTTADLPPVDPFDVGVTYDAPPAEPFDVPITLDPPPVLLEGRPGETPTLTAIINAVKDFDATLGNFLAGLHQINPIQISIQGAGALDPTVLAGWFRDYTQAVGPGKVGQFISQQESLFAMNPVVARVFNPMYFIAMSVPGAMGHVHATLDTQAGVTMDRVAIVQDVLLAAKVMFGGDSGLGLDINLYTPGNTQKEGQEFSVDEMVDSAIDGDRHPFMTDKRDANGLTARVFDSTEFFNDRNKAIVRARVGIENVEAREPQLAASNFLNGIVRMKISPKESEDGAVYTQTQNPAGFIDDDETRVPVCFTDLRKTRDGYRSVYFRPLNLSFSKSVSPEWQESSGFGRVDPIVSYQRTTRTYSVSFELHAFAPEDLQVMYNKMTWLDSMCYPSYGADSLMKSGPVIRMRIGDAVNTESGGLTGIIKSVNYDFADALWELKKGFKVPRSFKVSLEFLALHEGPVGLINGVFGVFKLPVTQQEKQTPAQFTNFVDNSIANAGRPRDASPKGAEVIPGMYNKFGEPKKVK